MCLMLCLFYVYFIARICRQDFTCDPRTCGFFFFPFFFLDHVFIFLSLVSFIVSSQVMLWLLVIISDLADVLRAVTSTRSCNYRGASLTPFICFSYPPSREKERPREKERSNMNEWVQERKIEWEWVKERHRKWIQWEDKSSYNRNMIIKKYLTRLRSI